MLQLQDMEKFARKDQFSILYMGTPDLSACLLNRLLESGYRVAVVICNPDKETGRKRALTPCPVKRVALEHGIPVYSPAKIRLEHDFLHSLSADLILTFSYGQIVPKAVLDFPRFGCLNLHGSLLPAYRGAAPMQRALLNGDEKTGVTLMEMVEAMDAGRMYAKREIPLSKEDNYTSLCQKMAEAAFMVFDENILAYLNGDLPGVRQDESLVSIAKKIKPEEEKLDLADTREHLFNKIRALSFTPGAYFLLDGKKLKVLSSAIEEEAAGELGSLRVEKKRLSVLVGDGYLGLKTVQLEGKKAMDVVSFLQGQHGLIGKKLS